MLARRELITKVTECALSGKPFETWLPCDGSTLSVSSYPELYAILGKKYGGGTGTFNLPDVSGLYQGINDKFEYRIKASGGDEKYLPIGFIAPVHIGNTK